MKQIKNTIRINPDRPPNRRRVRMITDRIHQPSPFRRLQILPRRILIPILDITTRHGRFRRLTRIILLGTGSIGRDTIDTSARPFRSRPCTFTTGSSRSCICGRRRRRQRRLFLELLLPGRWNAGAGGLVAAIFPGCIAR